MDDDEILRESMENKRINQLICNNKFIIFTSDDKENNFENNIDKNLLSKIEKIIHTKNLDKKERNIVVRRKVIESVSRIKDDYKLEIMLDINQKNDKEY